MREFFFTPKLSYWASFCISFALMSVFYYGAHFIWTILIIVGGVIVEVLVLNTKSKGGS